MNIGTRGINRDRYEIDKPSGYTQLDQETQLWYTRALANGGIVNDNSLFLANNLILALKARSYNSKIKWLAPYFGSNIGAATIALRDSVVDIGIMTNPYPGKTAFVNADFSEATGLQGTANSGKVLSTNFTMGQLNANALGGMGMWDRNLVVGSNSLQGSASSAETSRWGLDLRTASAVSIIDFGANAGAANAGVAASSGHYYGQRSSATAIALYKNGVTTPIATSTPSDTAPLTGINDFVVAVMGAGRPAVTDWGGRAAVHYFTDGTLSTADIADLHQLLTDYIITPTGR